jgi:hypothetical protein
MFIIIIIIIITIIIATNARESTIKLTLKLLRHFRRSYTIFGDFTIFFCQLKLWIIELIKYNIANFDNLLTVHLNIFILILTNLMH